MDLTFKELKIYYIEKDYHLDDKTFETNLNLKNQNGLRKIRINVLFLGLLIPSKNCFFVIPLGKPP